jgi:hypothetical protein
LQKSWAAVAEDYRLVAEALRVQVVWWHLGLTARRDRVDNHVLRYDTGEFQLLRQGLGTVLDAILFCHAAAPAVAQADRLPEPVIRWIGDCDPANSGQIQYHWRTAKRRKLYYGAAEFVAWSLFAVSLGAATWLAIFESMEALHHPLLEIMGGVSQAGHPWFVPALGTAIGAALLAIIGVKDIKSPDRAFRASRIVWSWLAGTFFGVAMVAFWSSAGYGTERLPVVLFLGSVLLLAWGGILRYWAEKIAIEAEAQGSAAAYSVYRRAREAIREVDSDLASKHIDVEAAWQRREQIIRDLGRFALTEGEEWLRSHRERPLHPALA